MGHPETLDHNSVDVHTPESDHNKIASNKNGFSAASVVDLSHKDISTLSLNELPLSLPLHSVTILHLNHNKLSTIPSGLHNILPNLRVFSVDENELSELPVDICELAFLQEIHVCKNKLTSVPHSMYKLKHLKILNLCNNKLKTLHPEIGQNDSLVELCVTDNVLTRFPATFGLLVNLRVLDAAYNQLESVPHTISFLTRLQVVNLKCNKLSVMSNSFSVLENLKHIDLSGNRLSSLWQTFASSHNLETIILDSNLINILPPWISQLDNAYEICVANNNLRHKDSFPLDFGKRLQRVKKLDLRGNFIETLPPSLSNLSSLQTLLLGTTVENGADDDPVCRNSNWIATLPNNFTDLKHLVFLNAEENQFVSLPEDFGCLTLLKDLRLGGNLLTSLPNSFCKLESLERCYLSKNKLKTLPEDFGRLDGLKELFLDCNKLKSLPLSMKNCVQLEVLDLRGNRFMETSPDVLNVLTGLKDLRITQTPQADESNELSASNNCTDYSDDELEHYDFPATPYEESWDDDGDSKSTSSGSSMHHTPSVKDDEENWDVDTCQSADNDESDSGQFELDGEEKVSNRSLGTTFDVYGNASQRIDLGITQHRMLPYLLHRPRNVWGHRETSPVVVEEQYDDAV